MMRISPLFISPLSPEYLSVSNIIPELVLRVGLDGVCPLIVFEAWAATVHSEAGLFWSLRKSGLCIGKVIVRIRSLRRCNMCNVLVM